ncbi:MAG: thiamine phosphate synthase [Armatimonadetes bacterium]|nr:thiamine phosphate synthase [Armatimonadota bacterium]
MQLRPCPFRLYLVTDRRACFPTPLSAALEEACAAGIRAVQLREKDLTPREVHELSLAIKPVLDRYGTSLLINDRSDLARTVRAAGVHLTSTSLSPAAARPCLLPDQIIGVSTHSVAEGVRAEQEGADFLCFGPVYDTPSKHAFGPPQGLENLRKLAEAVSLPVYAIGGVTPERTGECIESGAYGVAVIAAILGAKDIGGAVEDLLKVLPD